MSKKLKKLARSVASPARGLATKASRTAKNVQRDLVTKAKPVVRDLAYSQPVRQAASTALDGPAGERLQKIVDSKGLASQVRQLMSEELPEGYFYAKFIINNWNQFNGQSFQLMQDGQLIYGNRVEAPQRGFPLEYRNIVVSTRDVSRFSINLPTTFKIVFSKGRFSTAQQDTYDKKYGVEQHGKVYYSLRGNTKNPSKILVTFPGFGPSTTRISYAVSFLQQLTEVDLKDTLLLAFQDRYSVAGTYMLADSMGRDIRADVREVIDGFMEEHNIDASNMLIFGASKGASSALVYAEPYAEAQILVAVPQLNLPYYFSKPFFVDNLYLMDIFHEIEQPGEKLRRYVEEGRSIDYFYTNNDELSNFSIPEFLRGYENLRKYRFDGVHGAVARAALPTMLGIMRRFMNTEASAETLDLKSSKDVLVGDMHVARQVRLGSASARLLKTGNKYVVTSHGGTEIHHVLTMGARQPILYYTADEQLLWPSLGEAGARVVFQNHDANGKILAGELPGSASQNPADDNLVDDGDWLDLTPDVKHQYRLLNNMVMDEYEYIIFGDTTARPGIQVHVVAELPKIHTPAADLAEIYVSTSNSAALLDCFLMRIAALLRSPSISVEVDIELSDDVKQRVHAIGV